MDTIFALATARGKSGVAVVRLSGPDAVEIGAGLAGSLGPAREMVLRPLRGPDGQVLDRALVVFFPADASFTGEPVVELHLHGSAAVVSAILGALGDHPRARLAEPGEFTRRALENDRLDLAQVEGLADLIDAETEAQRRQALRVLSGALGEKAEAWRVALVRAAALIEATIDFADEEVPVDVSGEVSDILRCVSVELDAEIEGEKIAERISGGFEVALVGAPNTGKSTLLNALAGREAAITSPVAGTTRDIIELRMDISGLPVTFLDMAGLRETSDEVEGIGVDRAFARAEAADLRVFILEHEAETPLMAPVGEDLVVLGKVDLLGAGSDGVSGKTGQGVEDLLCRISDILAKRAGRVSVAIKERHRVAMAEALAKLGVVGERLSSGEAADELAAEDLRSAVRALDSLVGRVDVEHVLDEIFQSFCIGK